LSTDEDRITVYVDNHPVKLYRGMRVSHALISYRQSLYEAARRGEVHPVDENGFRLGLEGAVCDGTRIFLKSK
jgi:hypothetical protein